MPHSRSACRSSDPSGVCRAPLPIARRLSRRERDGASARRAWQSACEKTRADTLEIPDRRDGASGAKERSMTYTVKPLSCEPTKLKGLSEKLIISHWENNYGGAARRLNAIATTVGELDFAKAPVFVINGLKREELIATNSMILHELYFDSLGGDGISGGAIDEALARDFGSVDRWRAEFVGTGKALRGASGWVLLTYSHRNRRLVNQW